MITKFAEPEDHQHEGDPCESCHMFWEHQGLPPMPLVYLRDKAGEIITTSERNIPILTCPRCDGDWIMLLPKD